MCTHRSGNREALRAREDLRALHDGWDTNVSPRSGSQTQPRPAPDPISRLPHPSPRPVRAPRRPTHSLVHWRDICTPPATPVSQPEKPFPPTSTNPTSGDPRDPGRVSPAPGLNFRICKVERLHHSMCFRSPYLSIWVRGSEAPCYKQTAEAAGDRRVGRCLGARTQENVAGVPQVRTVHGPATPVCCLSNWVTRGRLPLWLRAGPLLTAPLLAQQAPRKPPDPGTCWRLCRHRPYVLMGSALLSNLPGSAPESTARTS